jgi:hypothetical protein
MSQWAEFASPLGLWAAAKPLPSQIDTSLWIGPRPSIVQQGTVTGIHSPMPSTHLREQLLLQSSERSFDGFLWDVENIEADPDQAVEGDEP